MKPAHKNTEHPPGQVTYEDKGQRTLSDYIRSINKAQAFDDVARETKLTFDEWLRQSSFVEPDAGTYSWLKDCWNAALTKGKL